MTEALRFRGAELDGATALMLLEWQCELGADEAMLDAPVNRLAPVAAVAEAPLPTSAPPRASVRPAIPAPAIPPSGGAVAEAEALAGRARTLADLAAAQAAFDGVEIKRGARNFCFADGNPDARLMIVTDAPDEDEDAAGCPLAGRTGQLLDRMLAAIGLSRSGPDPARTVYIASAVPWRPPGNRQPEAGEIAATLPFLRRHVELAAPDVVLLMGNTPCEAGLGRGGVLRLRGQWTQAFGRPAMPIAHPAYLLRNPAAKREAWADLLEVAARLGL